MHKKLIALDEQIEAIRNASHIIFDVDNTVTKDLKPISTSMSILLRNLTTINNKQLYFMSGTSIPELHSMVSSKLNCIHILAGGSGTHIARINGVIHSLLHYDKMDAKDKCSILGLLDMLMIDFDIPKENFQVLDRKTQITFSILGRYADPKLKNNYDPDGSKRKRMVEYLHKYIPSFCIKIGGTTSIDITAKAFDKSDGIELLKVSVPELTYPNTLFIGDSFFEGGNDLPVLKLVKGVEVAGPNDLLNILKRV